MFYYAYFTDTDNYVYPNVHSNIKHGIPKTINPSLGEYQQPAWTDIDTIQSVETPIPSYVQGSGIHPEPYYEHSEVDDPTTNSSSP
jgi:phage major head subunit gpT-like protein